MPTHEEIRENTRKQWNEFSGGWKKWDNLIMEALRVQGEELLETVPSSVSNVLDVATGTGEPGLTIAERFPDAAVTGADLSEGMLAVAQEQSIRPFTFVPTAGRSPSMMCMLPRLTLDTAYVASPAINCPISHGWPPPPG